MDFEEALHLVREAVVRVKAESVPLVASQLQASDRLGEPPIYLDSLEFVAMVASLEDELGLVADDDRFSPGALRTVGDVVGAVTSWVAAHDADR